jgi:hypothetical protein
VGGIDPGGGMTSVSHVIQTALTPVFLLSGIASLLNVFNQRLSRIADHYEHVTTLLDTTEDADKALGYRRHLARLRRRRTALDTTLILATLAGASTCGAAFALFVVTLRDSAYTTLLIALFGGALGCTVASLTTFLIDTLLAWHGIRQDGPLPRSMANQAPPA